MARLAAILLLASLTACTSGEFGEQTLELAPGLTVLTLGRVAEADGSMWRTGGFTRAALQLRVLPRGSFDIVAHWSREDGTGLPGGPTDTRQISAGPAGIISVEFVGPSPDARRVLVELAPAKPAAPSLSPPRY